MTVQSKFINDNDTVIMKGSVKMDRYALDSEKFLLNSTPLSEIIDIQDRFDKSPICNSKWDFYFVTEVGLVNRQTPLPSKFKPYLFFSKSATN
jgi:hypothetical protein